MKGTPLFRHTLAIAAVGVLALAGCSSDSSADAAADTGSDRDLLAQAEDIQADLDPFFEGCEWTVNVDEPTDVQTSCAAHEIGVVVGDGSVQVVLDAIGESTPVGGYVTEDNWAVWSTDDGNVNMAWDVLGASGERDSFRS